MTNENQELLKLADAVKRNRMTDQLAQQCAHTELELVSNDLDSK